MSLLNNRIYFAVQQVGIAVLGSNNYTLVHGVQSIGITTTFNLEQVFELGQLSLYENIENIPDVECTIEKVLDGNALIYALASSGAASNTLSGRSNSRCMVALSVFRDTQDRASGDAIAQATLSGMYVSALTYTLPVDGNCTESVTLVGNDKTWASGAACTFDGQFTNTRDTPRATTGVQRRENVSMNTSFWPTEIPGLRLNSGNEGNNSGILVHIQNTTISTNLGREELFELGRRGPYFRFVTFPIEVTCSIDVTTGLGDLVNAAADPAGGTNLTDQRIYITLDDGTIFDLGTANKLSSITQTGGDATGGNSVTTYNYSNFNDLIVRSPN